MRKTIEVKNKPRPMETDREKLKINIKGNECKSIDISNRHSQTSQQTWKKK